MSFDRRCHAAVAALFCLLCSVVTVSAAQQFTEPVPLSAHPVPLDLWWLMPESHVIVLSEQRIQEVGQWTHEFDEWQQWVTRWLNRPQPGFWAASLERSKKPDPPVWLEDACELLNNDEQLARPCELLAVWHDDPIAARNRQVSAAALTQREAPTKTSWWHHAHFDAMWSTTQSNMTVFGVLGAHVTMEVEGRFQVFVAPGIILVSVPGLSGGRELMPATDWGVTYRLFNMGHTTVHFNLVHAWMLVARANLVNPHMTLAGFSFSFRPPHP
jgi:hypothetical protein